jgi:hypothetical protein
LVCYKPVVLAFWQCRLLNLMMYFWRNIVQMYNLFNTYGMVTVP